MEGVIFGKYGVDVCVILFVRKFLGFFVLFFIGKFEGLILFEGSDVMIVVVLFFDVCNGIFIISFNFIFVELFDM